MRSPAEPFARLSQLIAENRNLTRFSHEVVLQSQRLLDGFDVRGEKDVVHRLIEESLLLLARSRELSRAIRPPGG